MISTRHFRANSIKDSRYLLDTLFTLIANKAFDEVDNIIQEIHEYEDATLLSTVTILRATSNIRQYLTNYDKLLEKSINKYGTQYFTGLK